MNMEIDLIILKEKIIKTNYLENRKVGITFTKRYPKLFEEINGMTKDLENTFFVNTYLRARVIFIFKYDCDLNNIKANDKEYLTFDRKKDDFINKTIKKEERLWYKLANHTDKDDFYNKEETINILKENNYYLEFFGKGKNFKMLRENKKLHTSIYEHTKILDSFNKNSKKFTTRISFLVIDNGEPNRIKCTMCKTNFTSIFHNTNYFYKLCKLCFNSTGKHHYPSIEFFKNKYGNNWEEVYKVDRAKAKTFKVNSKKWFIKKYGEVDGLKKYSVDAEARVLRLQNLKSKKYSNISQELFWLVYEKLNDEMKSKCYFKELNDEYYIRDVENGIFCFADFKCGNKIIEYDGKYWHKKNNNKDNTRNGIYEKQGYDILIINEDDYRRGKNPKETITRCLEFLNSEIKYKI